MDLWCIMVLAVLKRGLNCDYQHQLTDYANEHGTLRQTMGHGIMKDRYERRSITDNVRLLSPQLLARISQR